MSNSSRTYRAVIPAVLVVLALAGCATKPGQIAPDPLKPVNRVTSTMNKVMQDVVLTPASKAYVTVTPEFVQTGIHNFFSNLTEPIVIINDLLQGKFSQSGSDTLRFLVNSTIGIVGLIDVATRMGLAEHNEDFGQTMAVWGVPTGPYLVVPLLGPSTFRDALGSWADSAANPLAIYKLDNVNVRNALLALKALDAGRQLLRIQDRLESAYDRYLFIRDAWLQHRRFEVYDGNPPQPQYPTLPPLPPASHAGNSSKQAVPAD